MAGSSLAAVGLDTSVVMRLLVAEPESQAERARAFVVELNGLGQTAIVSDLVVAEAYFALHTHYSVPKREAVAALLRLLCSPSVELEPGGNAVAALEAALAGSSRPGFVDRLIHAQYDRIGVRMASFEKASKKLAESILLEA